MLKKVISGGQTGADEGGLFAAKKYGLETGGWIPKGFITEKGPNTKLGTEYGLVETETADYVPRTHMNARDADATIRIAHDFNSAGEICTLKAITKFNKPHMDVNVHRPPAHEEVARWLIENNVEVLNVAGNRESKAKGIFEYTVNYLTEVFECLDKLSALKKLS